MFTEPKHGWTNLKIGDICYRASYLTDIPIDCLDAFIYALKNHSPATVYFDAEGWEHYLVSYRYDSYVIVNKNTTTVEVIEKDYVQLAKELIKDIKNYFDGWVNWECYHNMNEEETKERENMINDRVFKLEELIKKIKS